MFCNSMTSFSVSGGWLVPPQGVGAAAAPREAARAGLAPIAVAVRGRVVQGVAHEHAPAGLALAVLVDVQEVDAVAGLEGAPVAPGVAQLRPGPALGLQGGADGRVVPSHALAVVVV